MSKCANIQQRGGSFLVDVSRNGKRERVTCATIEEAQSVRDKLAKSLLVVQADTWTLGEAYKRCHESVWAGTPGEAPARRNAEVALGFFGVNTPVEDVTADWIDAWIGRMKQIGNSNATINRKLAALSKILTFAWQRKKLKSKPYMQRQVESQGRVRFLTQSEEVQGLAFLSQWGKDDHAEAFCILVDSGMRPSELWRLEARDCDVERGLMTIWQTKNKEPRTVPMTQRVKEIITRRIEHIAKGPLFPFDNDWFQHVWDRMRYAMGLHADEQFIPYALRHTCASRLVQRKVSLRVVQEWMGHKTIQITMRYAHLTPANLIEAVKVLEAC